MRQIGITAGFVAFLCLTCCSTHDLHQTHSDLYRNEEGSVISYLLSNRVLSLAVDSGYVWIGTDRGLSRYDKQRGRWVNFTVKDGLAHNSVLSIALDEDWVWIGTKDGANRYHMKTNTWRRYMPRDGLAGREIACIAADSRFVWFGTPSGVSRYDKETNSWARKRERDGLAGNAVSHIEIGDGYIWIGTDNGVSRYDKLTDSWNNYDKDSGLVDNSVSAIAIDGDAVWFGTENGGISRYDQRNSDFVRTYTKKDRLTSDRIRALAVDGTSLWLGTADSGAQRYISSVNTWLNYSVGISAQGEEITEPNLASNHITAIAPDGNVVWFGTYEHGLVRYNLRHRTWNIYGEIQALSDNDVKDISVTDESVWVATRSGLNQATHLQSPAFSTGLNWRTTRKADGLSDNYITSVLEIEEDLWVGTPSGLGLRHRNEGKWTFFSTKDGLSDDYVTCLAWEPANRNTEMHEGSDGMGAWKKEKDDNKGRKNDARLWIGTKAGLSTYEPQNHRWNAHPSRLQISGWINDIQFDGDYVWFATEDGLFYYDEAAGESGKLTVKDGLPSEVINTTAIGDYFVWVGTLSGLVQFGKSSFTSGSASLVCHLSGTNIRAIAVDGGAVWVGTPSGLYNFAGGVWTHYTRENTEGGLVYDNVQAIAINNGQVWVGTTAGLSCLDTYRGKWWHHLAATSTEVLQSNWVSKLANDGDALWFSNWKHSTEGAIVRYDKPTKTFRFFSKDDLRLKPTDSPVTLIHGLTVGKNAIWAGTNGGMLRYDRATDTWRHYTAADGLPNNEVWSIVLDASDVWLAHMGGVVSRYSTSTEEWKTYEISPSVEWSGIGAIAVEPQYVWVTTMWDGLKRYDKTKDTWSFITEVHGLGNNEANDLLIDGDYVWVTGWGDASRYNRRTDEWEIFSRGRVLSDVNLGLTRGLDGVWIAYPWRSWGDAIASKYHNKTDSWTTLKLPAMKEDYFGRTMQIVETDDSVWFAVESQGLARYNKASKDWMFFDEENGLMSNALVEHSLVVDEDYVWLGTGRGLARYDLKSEVWKTFTQSPLAPIERARKVYAIAADARYLWLGTPDGLHRYDKRMDRWYTHRPKGDDGEERNSPSVTCLAVDEKFAWLGTNEGVLRYDKAGDHWETYTEENGLPSNAVRDVVVKDYDVWIATDGGVAVFNRLSDDPNAWEPHTQELEVKPMQDVKKYAQTLLSNDVRCVGVGDDAVWFGTDNGACHYDRTKKTWKPLTAPFSSLLPNPIFAEPPLRQRGRITDISVIAVDEVDVWFGTGKGATKYNVETGEFDIFTQSDGLASNVVTCIALNGEEIWFGSADAGAACLDKATGRWRVINKSDGLLHNGVEAIAFDGDQRWFGTELGLCRLDSKTGTWTSYAEDFNR